MKILFTTHWYPSPKNLGRGPFIKKQYEGLSKKCDVDLLIIDIKKSKKIFSYTTQKELDKNNNTKYHIKIYSLFWKWIYLIYPIQKLLIWNTVYKQIVRNGNYDIIHGNVGHPNGVAAYFFSKKLKVPLVISEHLHQTGKYLKHPLTSKAMQKAYQKANLIFVSKYLANKITNVFPIEKKTIIGNIVNSNDFFYSAEKKSREATVFTSVASWNQRKSNPKKPEYFIKSLDKYAQENPKQKFIINHIGQCSIKQIIKEDCITSKNLSINFLGYLDSKKINNVFNQSDIFAHPTNEETFCIVSVEAQKAGLPVLMSEIDVSKEVLDPQGLVSVKNDNDSWFEGVSKIIHTEFNQKELANRMNKYYTEEKIVNQILNVYQTVENI